MFSLLAPAVAVSGALPTLEGMVLCASAAFQGMGVTSEGYAAKAVTKSGNHSTASP